MKEAKAYKRRSNNLLLAEALEEGKKPEPKKSPRQKRSQQTVIALYGALIRIWKADGLSSVTMRRVSEESGYAIGTVYEYFPNINALMLGYVHYFLDEILHQLDQSIKNAQGPWNERVEDFVRAHLRVLRNLHYDFQIHKFEKAIGSVDDYSKFFSQLVDRWEILIKSWEGPQLSRRQIANLVLMVFGAIRYKLALPTVADLDAWLDSLIDSTTQLIWAQSDQYLEWLNRPRSQSK